MASSRITMTEYLWEAKKLSECKRYTGDGLHIVMGNESCDLDSAVCALLYGYYLSSGGPTNSGTANNSGQTDTGGPSKSDTVNTGVPIKNCDVNTYANSKTNSVTNFGGPTSSGSAITDDLTHTGGPINVIPILNIPASHLPIKTEVVYFLRENSIPLDSLVFRDSLDLEQLSRSCNFTVTLVDHHVLSMRDQFLAPHVREILDHRPVLEDWPHLDAKTMDIVGSCVTHVARKILDNRPELIRDYPNLANLIYGTILLDTACLSEQAQRATPADLAIVTQLKSLHARYFQPESQLFASIQEAKSDVSHLSVDQLLIKDLKFTKQGVPIAGLPILVQEFLKKSSHIQTTLDRFLCDNHACLLILMGQRIRDGNIERDLGLYTLSVPNSDPDNADPTNSDPDNADPEFVEQLEKILDHLKSSTDPSLQLKETDEDSIVKVFSIGNVRVSRKQVLPLVELALES